MGQVWVWAAAGALVVAAALLLRKPLGAAGRLALRSGAGMCAVWLFNQVGAVVGLRLGVNLITGAVLGVLGVPGFGLLLMVDWLLR